MKAKPVSFSNYFVTPRGYVYGGSYASKVIELSGGVNENVSSLELKAGELIDCVNYMMAEGAEGGYTSVAGFERMDGAILPSAFESILLTLTSCSIAINKGDTLTQVSDGATCIALEDGVITSGSYIEGDATVTIQCRKGTGDILPGESIDSIGTISLVETITGGTEDYHAGIEYARQAVKPVPGEGPVLGLHIFENIVHAFRKKEGIDEVGFYKEDATSGWVEIDTSANPIAYGDSDFKFTDYNFKANADSYSMYWCDGVNKARAYDGTLVTVIDNSGMEDNDIPINIIALNFYLFLVYPEGSLQYSQLGLPNGWDGTLGAGEIGLGDDVRDLAVGVDSTLILFLRQGIRILSGTTADTFNLTVFSQVSGAFPNTAQRMLGTIFFVEDRGLTTLSAVEQYGSYASNSISQKFKKTLLNSKHNITTAMTSRDLNQYRIFFDDKSAIFVSFEDSKQKGATFIAYNKVVSIAAQGEDSTKSDYMVFASTDDLGYVFKMDSGTSFDGSPITTRMSTAYYHYGSPRSWKMFKGATFEIFSESGQEFSIKVDFDYNEVGSPGTIWYDPQIINVTGGAIYGEGIWGKMRYGVGTAVTNRIIVYLQGKGTNMSYKILTNETYRPQHTIQNIITDYIKGNRRV